MNTKSRTERSKSAFEKHLYIIDAVLDSEHTGYKINSIARNILRLKPELSKAEAVRQAKDAKQTLLIWGQSFLRLCRAKHKACGHVIAYCPNLGEKTLLTLTRLDGCRFHVGRA